MSKSIFISLIKSMSLKNRIYIKLDDFSETIEILDDSTDDRVTIYELKNSYKRVNYILKQNLDVQQELINTISANIKSKDDEERYREVPGAFDFMAQMGMGPGIRQNSDNRHMMEEDIYDRDYY